MKIIQLIQKPQLRGAELFACQLSNHLLNLGHEVIMVSIFSGEVTLPFKGKSYDLNRPIKKRFYDFKGWKEFSKIINEFQPDIIQANAADTLKYAVSTKLAFSLSGANLVFRNANKMGDFIDSKLKLILNKFYIKNLDSVISVSKECEIDFIKTFKYKGHIETIEIGVEDKEIGKTPSDLTKVFQDSKVICHIGSFVPEKNHLGLIRMVKDIIPEYPDLRVLLIGKGAGEEKVKNELRKQNLEDNFVLLGYRTDVLEILSNSDAFILPSLIEGLPGVILEAMYCKTPVVAYNVGGVGEVVRPNYTGWLIEKNEESKFVENLKLVLDGGENVKLKVDKAKGMIHSKFLNSIISQRFLDCYNKLIED